jgi:nucleoid DNA-binding protein
MPSNKPAIHWLGAGLASGPGLISLVNKWGEANVWSMEINRPRKLLSKVNEGATLNVHSLALEDNNSVEIRGLGRFSLKDIKEKKSARNPKTGELIYVPAKKKVAFKMSKHLKEEIN